MEQAKNEHSNNPKTLSRKAQYIGLGSLAFFASSLGYFTFVSFGAPFQDLTLTLVALSALTYFAGLRLRNYSLVSGSWILLGIVFVISWIMALGAPGDMFSIFTWSAVLLGAYELDRFAFAVQSRDVIIGGLDVPSAKKYENVIRTHAISTVATILASTAVSILVVILSSNFFIIGIQPVLGVVAFAFLVVLVAFTLIFSRATKLDGP
ncbi:MAG: hypothetical protein JRN20_07380 [Nitrososphaerota archaeon]|nr:hypothetical protein [Nitrososphaerota archaeon]